VSATPTPATWRSGRRLLCEFGCVQSSTRREDKAVKAMDQARTGEPAETVRSINRAFEHESDLVLRPRSLRIVVQQNLKDCAVRLSILLGHTHRGRLGLHGSSRSFATPPAVRAVRGHFDRDPANLTGPANRINEFRYSFRQTLLDTPSLQGDPDEQRLQDLQLDCVQSAWWA
jgi:hypothetical protein